MSPTLDGAKVTATVLGEGRGEKILVFKLKRKKQYKKMQGHRQNFVEVKINEILVNGKSFKAEEKAAEAKPERQPRQNRRPQPRQRFASRAARPATD